MRNQVLPYQPANALGAKIARKLLPYRARRDVRLHLKRSIISFTFDDFPLSAIENGARILEDHNWRATFYVAAGLAGTTNHHGLHFRPDDLTSLERAGHEIAGHTYGHVDCAGLDAPAVMAQIHKNKAALRQMGVKGKLDHFAFPYGGANADLKKDIAAEFKTLRGIKPGVMRRVADLSGLKSTPLFSKTIDTAVAQIRSLTNKPGWLTLFAHDITNSPSAWGCTPAEFAHIVETARKSGARVMPIGAALGVINGGGFG